MAKPICTIKIDLQRVSGGVTNDWAMWQETFEKKLPDYHVFVIPIYPDYNNDEQPIEFQVFYEKDFTEIQYDELKKLINNAIKETTSNKQ